MAKVTASMAVRRAWSLMAAPSSRSTPVVMPIATKPLKVITAR